MQQAAQNGSGRREERVPLEAFIELQSDEHVEPLTADGLNVSIGGVAMRAGFVPPLGALLECRFACPPRGDVVCALGEVVWSEWRGSEEGHFGLRFLELDTKSATTLREYLEPEGAYAPAADRLRAASLLIDGLGTAVEADLKLADETRVVLEQQLTFLQLGRGVEVSVLGRGKERGRIASIELRQTHFDVPTLVFGILLDDAPGRAPEAAESGAALFAAPAEAPRTVWARETASAEPVYAVEVREPPPIERGAARAPSQDEELELPTSFTALRRFNAWCGARWRTLWTSGRAPASEPGPSAQVEPFEPGTGAEHLEPPDLRTRLLLQVARLRSYALRGWSALRRPKARGVRSRRPPPLRLQRSTAPGALPPAPAPVVEPVVRRPVRVALAALATLGVALGVYALAPRSGADRMRTPPPAEPEEPLAEELDEGEPARPAPATESNFATTVVESAPDPRLVARRAAPSPSPARAPRLSAPFGDTQVPNGRTFSLRMNGPVETVEGENREHGFTVRIPRRLALDRASPIASSHRAVARAMILNRGGYAELTVDFAAGVHPRYQVLGKDNTLEITIERL